MEEKNTNAAKRKSPVTWVPSVYFAMGLPFVVLNMVVVLMFKGMEISDAQIALWTSVIMLPWTLKPLWSPFLEMYRTKKFFVVLTQILSGCLFGLVALALNLSHFFALSIALLGIIALSGATHDVATDGVYMNELSPEEQAKYIGWQGAFYNLAKIVATGGLVYLAGSMMNYFTGVLHEETYRMVHLLHHLVPLRRGIRDQDSSLIPEGARIRARVRAYGARDRFVLWYLWSRGVRIGVVVRRLLYIGTGLAESIVLALLLFQHTVFGIYVPRLRTAGQRFRDRLGDRIRIFRIWFWIRGVDTLHDATSSSREAPDGALCVRFRNHEFGRDASGYDQRVRE